MKSGFALLILWISSVIVAATEPSLVKVTDILLPGKTTRFDYQSFDSQTKILYFSHMGDGELIVFDTKSRKVIANLPGFPTVTGVLVVPELHRVYASVTDNHEVYLPFQGSTSNAWLFIDWQVMFTPQNINHGIN